MLSQFIFSFKDFTTDITFERFSSCKIFICFLNLYFLSNTLPHIWKVFIMNNFDMLSQFIFSFENFTTNLTWTILICSLNLHFVSNISSQISHLKGSHHEQFSCGSSIYIFFQIFCHKSHIWKVPIMNNFNMLSQFTFCFKYFITNLTFERFSSWTISICFLNLYFVSNISSKFSHLNGSHQEQF